MDVTGTLLASATFTNETASGWQQVNFSTPVKIPAGTTYIASYHTNGNYSDTAYYFDTYTGQTNGSLTATGDGPTASMPMAPAQSFPAICLHQGDNYWVDVVFNDTASDRGQQ